MRSPHKPCTRWATWWSWLTSRAWRESGCDPCVLPSMRGMVTWICQILRLAPPAFGHRALRALEEEVVQRRGQVVREAPPIPMGIMRCLETAFFQWTNDDNDPLVIFCWMVLIMTWGSMRYDDAAHIDPKSIQQTEFGVKFVAWQTKVDRKRRGTSFVVPDVAFGDRSWLVERLTWLRRVAPASFWDRDYMLIETDTSPSLNWDRPLLYHDFVAGLRAICGRATLVVGAGSEAIDDLGRAARNLTAHSLRVTMLDAMAHAGSGQLPLLVQGNWRDPSMPLKYARDRKAISVAAIKDLVGELKGRTQCADEVPKTRRQEDTRRVASGSKRSRRPAEPTSTTSTSQCSDSDTNHKPEEGNENIDGLRVWASRYSMAHSRDRAAITIHVLSPNSETVLACNTVALASCKSLGFGWPGFRRPCHRCRRNRPDWTAHEK